MESLSLRELLNIKQRLGNHIYVVWRLGTGHNGKRCIYIGRTVRGVKTRIMEHVRNENDLGRYLCQNSNDISISIYEPRECMLAVENEIGPGWNPEFIGMATAEDCMIKTLAPLLNKVGKGEKSANE